MDAHAEYDFSEGALLSSDAFARDQSGRYEQGGATSGQHEEQNSDRENQRKKSERVLATAGLPHGGEIMRTDVTAPVVSVAIGAEAPVTAIMERIEQALRAGMYPAAGNTINIKIHLEDMKIPGLKSLSISMTSNRLDLTFARDAGAPSPELLAAAQALASQLAARFPTRSIRVLDADAEPTFQKDRDGDAHGGLRAISDLLAGRFKRS